MEKKEKDFQNLPEMWEEGSGISVDKHKMEACGRRTSCQGGG